MHFFGFVQFGDRFGFFDNSNFFIGSLDYPSQTALMPLLMQRESNAVEFSRVENFNSEFPCTSQLFLFPLTRALNCGQQLIISNFFPSNY